MEFDEIKTFDHLRLYLSDKGKGHQDYRQYTNLDSIFGMINSGYLWLSRGDEMNDKQELTKGNPAEWENIYVASFVFGKSENIAMWAIYGLLHDEAACISFPSKAFSKWIIGVKEIFDPIKNYEKIDTNIKIDLTDVAYIGGKRGQKDAQLKWYDKTINLDEIILEDDFTKISNESLLTGYIKNYAWNYENEVRVRVKVDKRIECKKIAIKFPDDFFVPDSKNEKIGITTGPWRDDIKYDVFMEKMKQTEKYLLIKDKFVFQKSEFQNLVNLKETCEYCSSGNGKKIPKRKAPSIFA